MSDQEDKQEAAIAKQIAAITAINKARYTQLEIERRRMIAEHRKAEFDSHVRAGFTEKQALEIARLSI